MTGKDHDGNRRDLVMAGLALFMLGFPAGLFSGLAFASVGLGLGVLLFFEVLAVACGVAGIVEGVRAALAERAD